MRVRGVSWSERLHHAQGPYEEGEPYARQALDLRYRGDGPASTGSAGDLAVLGAILLGQRRYGEAETVLTRSLSVWESRFGPLHYEVAVVQHDLGVLYRARVTEPLPPTPTNAR